MKEFLVLVKNRYGCVVCEENSHPSVLEFHHVNEDDKEFTISSNRTTRPELVIEELTKCTVLCANCHRKHHAGVLNVASFILIGESELQSALSIINEKFQNISV